MTYKRLTFEGPAIAPGRRTRLINLEPFRSEWLHLYTHDAETTVSKDVTNDCCQDVVTADHASTLPVAA